MVLMIEGIKWDSFVENISACVCVCVIEGEKEVAEWRKKKEQ